MGNNQSSKMRKLREQNQLLKQHIKRQALKNWEIRSQNIRLQEERKSQKELVQKQKSQRRSFKREIDLRSIKSQKIYIQNKSDQELSKASERQQSKRICAHEIMERQTNRVNRVGNYFLTIDFQPIYQTIAIMVVIGIAYYFLNIADFGRLKQIKQKIKSIKYMDRAYKWFGFQFLEELIEINARNSENWKKLENTLVPVSQKSKNLLKKVLFDNLAKFGMQYYSNCSRFKKLNPLKK